MFYLFFATKLADCVCVAVGFSYGPVDVSRIFFLDASASRGERRPVSSASAESPQLSGRSIFGKVAEEPARGIFLHLRIWTVRVRGEVADFHCLDEMRAAACSRQEVALEIDFFDVEEELFVKTLDGLPVFAANEEDRAGGPVEELSGGVANVLAVWARAELVTEESADGGEIADGVLP